MLPVTGEKDGVERNKHGNMNQYLPFMRDTLDTTCRCTYISKHCSPLACPGKF